jgi:hypothetical protein
MRLLHSLKGTTLNLKAFLSLIVKHGLSPDFPSYYSHRYLHEKMMAREHLRRLDAQNRMDMKKYVENIHTMERLTRVQVNLALLKMHHAQNLAAGKSGCAAASALRVDSDRFPLRRGRVSQMNRQQPPSNSMTIDVEVMGLRIGDFVLVTFPGELSVRIGLNIKKRSPRRFTFVAGCANGYIYYAPTAEQLRNRGGAQEDSDCLLSPEWQALYEKKAVAMLRQL